MIILYILIAEISNKVQEYLKKDFKILENWFYDNYMVLNPHKCEFTELEKPIKMKYLPVTKPNLKKRNYY